MDGVGGASTGFQTTTEVINTFIRGLIGIGVPPVGNGNFGEVSWNGKGLPDAISATRITTEVSAILTTVGV